MLATFFMLVVGSDALRAQFVVDLDAAITTNFGNGAGAGVEAVSKTS